MTCVATLTGIQPVMAEGVRAGAGAAPAARGARAAAVRAPDSALQPAQRPEGRIDRKDKLTPEPEEQTLASAELARRLRDRDPGALEQLYELLAGRAFGLAYRVLDDGPAAEDVVQEAFLWVWNNADRIDPLRGRVESLLLTIVHRRAIDTLRARGRREALRGSIDADLVDERASDLFASIARALTHKRVRECVDSLSEDQRQAIELAYFGGMTHREISEATGAPIGTVKSRLRLGMAKLRASFGIGEAQ